MPQAETIRPRQIFEVKAAIKLPGRCKSATSKHQTLTFLVFVSAYKREEWPTGAAAVKAINYADVTGKAVNCIRCHMACGGGARDSYENMLSELRFDN